ncbi:MAG: thioredoxin [Lachnospiraceae bacterium]|nr:thioredoxin [Lachnospiraceae bacterium]
MAVKTITSANFEAEVLNAKEPVLVDVWAPWCGPCKMLSPIVDEVAEEAQGFSVGKVNADENQELVNRFHIMSIPTLLVFKNGELVNKSVGLISKDEVKALLG